MTRRRETLLIRVASLSVLWTLLAIYLLPMILWIGTQSSSTGAQVAVFELYTSLISNTLSTSLFAAGVSVLMGSSVACLCVFSDPRTQRILATFMTLPLLIGFLARNYAWLGLLSSISVLDWLKLIADSLLYSKWGVVFVMSTVFVPVAFFVTLQGFRSLRPEYFEAALTLGVSRKRSFWVVTLPIARRSIYLAFGLCFVLALGYFITPAMIGGGTQDFIGNSVLTLFATLGDTAGASLLGLYLFLTALIPMIVLVWHSVKMRKLLEY